MSFLFLQFFTVTHHDMLFPHNRFCKNEATRIWTDVARYPREVSDWLGKLNSYCKQIILAHYTKYKLVVLAQKQCSRCLFIKLRKTIYMIDCRWWHHDLRGHQNGPKNIFWYCRDPDLDAFLRKSEKPTTYSTVRK